MRVIRYRESFLMDRNKIFEFIISNFGLIYGDIFLEEVFKIIELLSNFPDVGKPVKNNMKLYKFNFGKNWYLYSFDNKIINFLGLIDTRRDMKKIDLKSDEK